MNLLTLILTNKRWCLIIVFLFVVMALLLKCSVLKHEIQQLEQNHTEYVNHANELLLQTRAEEAEKNLQLEKKYSEQIKKINRDAEFAHDRANSLSKQLTKANGRIKTARREAVEEYSRVQSNVLTDCIGKYRDMAKIADEHRADAERGLVKK